jgi:tRNA pseudouridine65 synthase
MDVVLLARGERWAVVGKPSGLPVHRSELCRERHTLVGAVRRRFGQAVSPVHRLDRATSGCLLLSLDPEYTATLQNALTNGEKRYVAFVRGHVATLEPIRFSNPLKDSHGGMREAETLLAPIAGSDDPRCSLVLATPITGRFHQIRRHLRDLSHPVLGDSTHGDTRVNRWWRENHDLQRLALHCLSISIPLEDGAITVNCPLPRDLAKLGASLPWWSEAQAALPELVEGAA